MESKFTKKNLCYISCLMVLLSVFFPYKSVSLFGSSASVSLIQGGDGIIILFVVFIAFLCIWSDKFILSFITGIVFLVLFFVENNNLSSVLQNGLGYYMLLIGAIALIIFSFLAQNEKDE